MGLGKWIVGGLAVAGGIILAPVVIPVVVSGAAAVGSAVAGAATAAAGAATAAAGAVGGAVTAAGSAIATTVGGAVTAAGGMAGIATGAIAAAGNAIRENGSKLARSAVDVVKEHPTAVASTVATIATAVVVNHAKEAQATERVKTAVSNTSREYEGKLRTQADAFQSQTAQLKRENQRCREQRDEALTLAGRRLAS